MLTRRDRCAMALALECVRGDNGVAAFMRARRALALGGFGSTSAQVYDAFSDAIALGAWRLLRARLALLLRAMLRADAGDFGPCVCRDCGHAYRPGPWERCEAGTERWHGCRGVHRRITPAWERAPRHER